MRRWIALLLVLFILPAKAAWYNNSWQKRIKVTVRHANVDADLTNFPVYLNLDDFPDSFFDDCLANGADLRITSSNETTELAREVVWLSKTSNQGELYFKAPNLYNSTNADFYLYYKNPSATQYGEGDTYGAENVWTNGYKGVWHLQESTGTTLTDSTASDADMTTSGSPTLSATGKIGKGVDFEASSSQRATSTDADLQITGDHTIQAWGNNESFSNSSAGTTIASWGENAAGKRRMIIADGANFAPPRLRYSSMGGDFGSGTTSLSTSTWYFYVGTVASGSGTVYVNKTSNGTGSPTLNAWSSFNAVIASTPAATGEYYDGILDEVRFSNVARTSTWLSTEYNNVNSSSTFYSLAAAEDVPETASDAIFYGVEF